MKRHACSNEPTNNINSFDETAAATTANLGNSKQTESKADKHSRKSCGRTARVTTVQKLEL